MPVTEVVQPTPALMRLAGLSVVFCSHRGLRNQVCAERMFKSMAASGQIFFQLALALKDEQLSRPVDGLVPKLPNAEARQNHRGCSPPGRCQLVGVLRMFHPHVLAPSAVSQALAQGQEHKGCQGEGQGKGGRQGWRGRLASSS